MIKYKRRNMLAALGLSVVAAFAPVMSSAAGETIRMIVPYGGGGLVDALVRNMAETMSKELGQPVVVENKPGSNGIIGATYVANSKADGTTYFVAATGPLSLNTMLRKNIPFSMDSFEPVGTMFSGPLTVTVPTSMNVNNLDELKAWAAAGKPMRYGMLGPGSVTHLFGKVLTDVLGTELTNVAYKDNAEQVVDMVGGQLELSFATPISLVKHVAAGDLKMLAISTEERMGRFPDIPSVVELGHPELISSFWFGLVAPAGTPEAEKSRVSEALKVAMSVQELQDRMIKVGMTPHVGGPAEMQAQLDWDQDFWGTVIRKNNISLD